MQTRLVYGEALPLAFRVFVCYDSSGGELPPCPWLEASLTRSWHYAGISAGFGVGRKLNLFNPSRLSLAQR